MKKFKLTLLLTVDPDDEEALLRETETNSLPAALTQVFANIAAELKETPPETQSDIKLVELIEIPEGEQIL